MTTSLTVPNSLRQSDLADLSRMLETQRAHAVDLVVPASKLHVAGTEFVISGVQEPALSGAGVTDVNGRYSATTVADEGIGAKLDINLPFLRRCRAKRPHLYDANINGWLDGDERKFLLRLYSAFNGEETGILRAFLSDSYLLGLDNFDSLLAVLQGITEAGINPDDTIIDADLTERRMVVRVTVPGIAAYAPKLLENYRNPFTGEDVGRGWTPSRLREAAAREGHNVQDKVLFAGFVITNSEVGNGRFTIFPRIVVGPCTNGLTFTAEGFAKVHMGGRMEEGIQWSQNTLEQNRRLVTAQATDAVSTFLNVEFMNEQVAKLEKVAGVEITSPEPVIKEVTRKLGFSDSAKEAILARFITGGQITAGGVGQAISAHAQEVSDGDMAWELEASALRSMSLASQVQKELLVGAGR